MDRFEQLVQQSAQPVCAVTLAGQCHRAAVTRFGPCALGLLAPGGDADRLLALVDADGREHGDFLAALTDTVSPLGRLSPSPPGFGRAKGDGLAFEGDGEIGAVVAAAGAALRFPWPLGGFERFGFLVLAEGEAPVDAESAAVDFTLLATTLFRKAERAAHLEARAWIDEELEQIVNLQQLLRPEALEHVAGARFAIHSEAFRLVGGDYFDVARFPHRRPAEAPDSVGDIFSVSIADVSGHGPAAAVEAAMLDAILRTFRDSRGYGSADGPADVLTYLNRHMFTRRPRASFVTALFSVYHPHLRELRYGCAGHPPALVRTDAGAVSELPVPGEIPIRVLPDYEWTGCTYRVGEGEQLVYYTDGVIEARSPGGDAFGQDRLVEAVAAAGPGPDGVLASVRAALDAHCNGRAADDDRTIIVLAVD